MPIHIITQEELAEIQDLRQTQKDMIARINDVKARIAQGADTERGALWPDLRITVYPHITSENLRAVLSADDFSSLVASLPTKERRELWIVPASQRCRKLRSSFDFGIPLD